MKSLLPVTRDELARTVVEVVQRNGFENVDRMKSSRAASTASR
jgi:hypothetical protein